MNLRCVSAQVESPAAENNEATRTVAHRFKVTTSRLQDSPGWKRHDNGGEEVDKLADQLRVDFLRRQVLAQVTAHVAGKQAGTRARVYEPESAVMHPQLLSRCHERLGHPNGVIECK